MNGTRGRARAAGLAAVVALLVPMGVGTPAAVASDGSAPARVLGVAPDWQERMLVRVNILRARAGVAPVRLCPALASSAAAHARDMASSGEFSHTGSAGEEFWERMASVGYRMRTGGENIAAGQRAPWEVMKQWRESPGHMAIITNPDVRHAGFAVAVASAGPYRTYWVQDFAAGGRC